MNKPFFEVDELPKAQREKVKKLLGNAVDKSFESLTKSEVDKLMKELGLMPRKGPAKPPSKSDMKTLEDRMRRAKKKMKGGAMKAKGMKKGGAMKSKGYAKGGPLTKDEARSLRKKSGAAVTKKEIDEMKIRKKTGAATTKKELDKMKKTSGKKRGGAMKAKGMAKGGMMKTKGMAKGGMMKSKGMAKGGAMKTKGGNRGGVKRNMRPPSSTKSGLYGR
jgi:hypothetical protein